MKDERRSQETRTAALLIGMLGFVLVGTPLVFYLWSTVNELLSGHVDGARDLLALPVLGLFLALLFALGRAVSRWDGPPAADDSHSTPTGDAHG